MCNRCLLRVFGHGGDGGGAAPTASSTEASLRRSMNSSSFPSIVPQVSARSCWQRQRQSRFDAGAQTFRCKLAARTDLPISSTDGTDTPRVLRSSCWRKILARSNRCLQASGGKVGYLWWRRCRCACCGPRRLLCQANRDRSCCGSRVRWQRLPHPLHPRATSRPPSALARSTTCGPSSKRPGTTASDVNRKILRLAVMLVRQLVVDRPPSDNNTRLCRAAAAEFQWPRQSHRCGTGQAYVLGTSTKRCSTFVTVRWEVAVLNVWHCWESDVVAK